MCQDSLGIVWVLELNSGLFNNDDSLNMKEGCDQSNKYCSTHILEIDDDDELKKNTKIL